MDFLLKFSVLSFHVGGGGGYDGNRLGIRYYVSSLHSTYKTNSLRCSASHGCLWQYFFVCGQTLWEST